MGDGLDIEAFHDGRWHVAARVELRAGPVRTEPTWLEYGPAYATEHLGACDLRAVSCSFRVDFELHDLPTFPGFTCDLIPQGEARRSLEARLRNAAQATSDWSVLRHGAHHPVGNLRVAHAAVEAPPSPGVDREAVVERGDGFREWAESEGLPMTGSSDTGGASPKLLLTEDRDGCLHADGALPDARAARHFLVKFPRGRTRSDALVLAHEPAYLELARRAGARCGAPLEHDRGTLFVPRFDRRVDGDRVERFGLESLYSLAGVVEPGAAMLWEDVCAMLADVVDDTDETIAEILRRDALSLALGNTDNHGRNTSILKTPDGRVTLSPLYDFAPMFLDPELVRRSTRWRSEVPGEPPDWQDVADSLGALLEHDELVGTMRDLGARIAALPDHMRALSVDPDIIRRTEPWIGRVSAGLEAVR